MFSCLPFLNNVIPEENSSLRTVQDSVPGLVIYFNNYARVFSDRKHILTNAVKRTSYYLECAVCKKIFAIGDARIIALDFNFCH